MGVGVGGHDIEYHGTLAYKGVHKEAAGKFFVLCSRETNIQALYMLIADGELQ